jgi:hypothetical protein
VQVASVGGIVADPQHTELPMFTTQLEAAQAAARMTPGQEHLYGWHTVAELDDERVARAMAALVGHGIHGDGSMIGRAISETELAAEAEGSVGRAEDALQSPESEYGRFLERLVRVVLDSIAS